MAGIASPPASADPRSIRDLIPQEPSIWDRIRAGLCGRRDLLLAALVASIGILAGWVWFGVAILPLLYLLPCAAMMAMCIKGHGTPTEKSVSSNPTSSNANSGLSQ